MLRVQHDPQKMSKAARARFWKAFDQLGRSNHSARGYTLTYLIEQCEQRKIPYRLTALPGMGYYLEKYDPHNVAGGATRG